MNKVILIGHLGKDAETRHTPSGVAVSNFSLATSRSVKGADGQYEDATDWHDIVLWNGEKVAQYLTKGKQVAVEGRLQTRSWEQDGVKKYRTEVIVDGFGLRLLGSKDSGERQPREAVAVKAAAPPPDDDIPF
jgi:single-strand DNA-binding protein